MIGGRSAVIGLFTLVGYLSSARFIALYHKEFLGEVSTMLNVKVGTLGGLVNDLGRPSRLSDLGHASTC